MLNNICEVAKIIPNQQFGFRHEILTVHAIKKFSEDICLALNNNEMVGVALLDLQTAFNKVWNQGLLYKLNQKKFPPELIKLLATMLTNGKKNP